MRTLEDNLTVITWYSGERLDICNNCMVFNKNDDKVVDDFLKEVNHWQSDNICTYITHEPLGRFLKEESIFFEDLYFGYDDGKLATVVMMNGGNNLSCKTYFKKYISECLSRGVEKIGDYMLLSDALVADTYDAYNNADIYYIAVNPELQGRGVGTRSISSINSNLDFFAENGVEHNTVQALVHYRNIASQKMFKRNGYSKLLVPGEKCFDNLYYVVEGRQV